MELTSPVEVYDLHDAHPETRAEPNETLLSLLEVLERVLRAEFSVQRTDDVATAALRAAMLAGWPSFRHQIRQVSQETIGTESYSMTVARAGSAEFVWPRLIGSLLAGVADQGAVPPAVTYLVR
jgi:hypothetical protein